MTRNDIIHRAINIKPIEIKQTTIKGQTSGAPLLAVLGFSVTSIATRGTKISQTEHPDN